MATILGLLLVVTVIANYLATTLPAQMSVNDLNHEIAVENQLGHFQAVLSGRCGPHAETRGRMPPRVGRDGSVERRARAWPEGCGYDA